MDPSEFSNEFFAQFFAKALTTATGVPWLVSLKPCDQRNGGGFIVYPPAERLVNDNISTSDWNHLRKWLGAIPSPSQRWYLFPDEIEEAFGALGYSRRVLRELYEKSHI